LAPAGLTEEDPKKLKVVDELPVGGFGNHFVSFTYLKTLCIHCSPCVLEVFTSLSLSDRVMVLTIMVALMDSGELIHPHSCVFSIAKHIAHCLILN
jgi:hypothetical protein